MRAAGIAIVLLAVAAGVWLLSRRPEVACARVAARCGLGEPAMVTCERAVAQVERVDGWWVADRLVSCMSRAPSCAASANCAAGVGGGLLMRSLVDFLDLLRARR